MNNNLNNKALSDEDLAAVTGGVKVSSAVYELKRKEFDTAWSSLNMEAKNVSGMRRAELFDQWEEAGFKADATSFILKST